MREIYVEYETDGEYGPEYTVVSDDEWFGSFSRREDAEEFAERKRLEP